MEDSDGDVMDIDVSAAETFRYAVARSDEASKRKGIA
jgi:hypothetical protein